MPRVLILPSFYPTQSKPLAGIFFADHARMIAASGWNVDLLYWEPRSVRELSAQAVKQSRFQRTDRVEEGVRVIRVHGWNPLAQFSLGGSLWASLSVASALSYFEGVGLPDLVHAHNALWAGEAARRLNRRTGVPYVVTEHSSQVLMSELGPVEHRYAQKAWTSSAAVTAVSHALARAMLQSAHKAVCITPNPVDVDFFSLPITGNRPNGGPLRLVLVANLNENKRVDLAIRAVQQLLRGGRPTTLRVVGDGPDRPRLVGLAHSLGVVENVIFAGARDRAGVRDSLWWADCYISTSRYETFGVAIAEALATGLPVVATRSGGPDEILRDGIGYLVGVDDEAEFLRILRQIVPSTEEERRRRREYVVSHFATPVIANRFLGVYDRVLSSRSRAL